MTKDYIQKNISTFEAKDPHSQTLAYFSPSKLTKKYIKAPFAKPFCVFSPQTLHSTQEGLSSLYTKEFIYCLHPIMAYGVSMISKFMHGSLEVYVEVAYKIVRCCSYLILC